MKNNFYCLAYLLTLKMSSFLPSGSWEPKTSKL